MGFPSSLRQPRVAFALVGALLLVGVVVFALSRGGNETEQRAAFSAFLRDRVIASPGVALPETDRALKKSFGPYAKHYDVLHAFQNGMRKAGAKNTATVMALAQKKNLGEYAEARNDLRKASKDAENLGKDVAALLTKADNARAELPLPEDLKDIYNKAYQKTVTAPANAARGASEAVRDWYAAVFELVTFINKNSRDVQIEGEKINLKNPGLMDDLTQRLQNLESREAALREAVLALTGALLQ